MSLVFIVAFASLALQMSIHKIGIVKKLELYINWCDWCFRFWAILGMYLLIRDCNTLSFIGWFASVFIAHLLDKIEVNYGS